MILKGAEISRYLARPDATRPALLIYGQDAMRVALKRAEAVAALTGPGADEEMRLTRMPGADLRKDPALLLDAIKEVGFFPGQRVVLVEDTPDAAAPAVAAAEAAATPGALAAEHAGEALVEIAPDLLEVGRSLVATAIAIAAQVVVAVVVAAIAVFAVAAALATPAWVVQ